ncbi:C-terminal processing protease CtpA/Prc [Chryseobacterium ginsenosidimutans]|uniref:S41 family peptidase n=1 Tax=Chryseobacterium ginsenosidimutans TaxID=687846 RepID=UPI002166EA91|nr:S41 family peptidase [Chryseobacterium ginsenosidimutans]MCS3870986.1 C-terminal processing protease CtpA/Prc [Chryseobacterium ginsenosidimutans]
MKKATFILFFCLFQQFIFAQKYQYNDFMKTWNFIKYYHPDVASGKIDADSLFLTTLKNISSKDDFNSVIGKLSQNLNKNFKNQAPTETSKDVLTKNQNFDWFQKNGKINSENKSFLNSIYNHRYNFELLKEGKSVSDEKKYSLPKNENLSSEYRLLTLAKIQGTVDYLFPHKYIMDKGFDEYFKNVLDENSKITSRKDFEIVLAKLVSKFKDSHSFSFYKQLNYKKDIFHGNYLAPFDFQIVDDHILVTKLIFPEICSKDQINVGDRITSINRKTIPQILKEKGELLSTSNTEKLVYMLSKYENNLIWTDDLQQKTLEVKSAKTNKKFSTKIDMIDASNKEKYDLIVTYLQEKIKKRENRKINNNDIAYFKINHTYQFINELSDDKIDTVMDSIVSNAAQKKAIVFDMRAYPDWGGFVNHFIYKYFSPTENYFYKYYAPNLKNIGTFVYLDDSSHYFTQIKDKKTHQYQGKVFILVNPESQSASEWYTMSLQKIFPQSLTIGQQTAGADGDLVKVNLPGDYLLEFTGNGIFYPDNSQTQQTGVRINELIIYTDQDFLEGRDLEFERVLNSFK